MLPFFKRTPMVNPPADLRDELKNMIVGQLSTTFVPDLPQIITETYQIILENKDKENTSKPILMSEAEVQRTITPDYLICLEDGVLLKFLKRHLKAYYNMTPQQYIEKWGLPDNYPLVAPNYSKNRSNLAKKFKLGQKLTKSKK